MRIYRLAAATITAAVALHAGCRREQPAAPASATTPMAAAQKPATAHDVGPGRYVGAARCAKCHAKNAAAWHKSWHARALTRPTPEHVVANFDGAHFSGSSSEAWMRRRGGTPTMRTRGPDGALADFRVDWLIGGKRMQDDVTVLADGRWQVLPVYFHVSGQEWVDYTESKQGALSPDHPFYWTNFRRMANRECLDCHVTGLTVRFDRGTHAWSTAFTDAGVACESCHGPGGKHAESTDPEDIFQPGKASPELALAVCAQCHGPRNPLFPLLDDRHRFVAGQRYDELYDPVVVLIGNKRSGDFFVDGRPKSSSFEYQAMLQSACHRRGGATCLSCHTAPHGSHQEDELRLRADETCRGCHGAVLDGVAAHSHHQTAAAQSCVACHMPKVVTGVLDRFADHALDVPSPASTLRHGVPNACGTCHDETAKPTPATRASKSKVAKLTTQQQAEAVARWWPEAGKRAARRLRLGDAFDDGSGAAGATALTAVLDDTGEAPTLRGAAALVLAMRFPQLAAARLPPLLDDAQLTVRAKACEGLALARVGAAADALAARLGDRALLVRQAAALALAALGDARGEPALRALGEGADSDHLMQPHFARAQLLLRARDLAGARRELEQVAALTPYFADAIVELAEVCARLGDAAAARGWADDVLRLDPSNKAASALRARL